jgi:DNA-binding CsgD family transcriptional regulator
LAVLHDIKSDRHLISGRKLLGLELKGAFSSAIQDSQMLAGFFGLTQREGDVAAQLSYGKNVGAIAACNGVSVGTVRVQLKALFQYINGFYNTRRKHSAIGGTSPVKFERLSA